MQNVGQQYVPGGAATSHQTAPFGHTTEQTTNHNGSITSSLRQFRKDKQPLSDNHNNTVSESHVARVAPHNHFPPNRSNDLYRFPTSQYQEYNLPSQTKYSEISSHPTIQDPIPASAPSVIHKAKGGKEYMELGNIQPQMKQHYADHINTQQNFIEGNLQGQYLHKEAQVHPTYKSESQYFPKDQFPHQVSPHNLQKYNMPPQVNKYSTSNDFLSKLERINPTMARSIMSDHHLQEAASSYRGMDQRMYTTPPQNRRYPGYGPTSLQNNHYPPPHAYPHMPPPHPQAYQNYPASCNYNRSTASQMGGPVYPSVLPPEHSMSPRRGYAENVGMMPMNYGVQQKMPPNYGHQYNPQEYAQHYQHRRLPMPTQDYYSQACRAQYLPHQMVPQEVPENRLTVSDNLKQYIENWADEETATEMQQIDNSTLIKENMRVREDQSNETAVYMINASELQYLENGIPVVTSENLVPSENGQYILKNGVSMDGMVRIVNKGSQMEVLEGTEDRVVNLHIMDQTKPPDCMMAAKPNEVNQRPNDGFYEVDNKPRVLVHQHTVIQSSFSKETIAVDPQKIGTSLPMITDEEPANPATSIEEEINRSIIKESKRETVDKNCSPININEIQDYKDVLPSVICPNKNPDFDIKNMPTIEELCEDALKSSEFDHKESLVENSLRHSSDLGETVIQEKPIFEPGTLALGDSLDLQESRERSPTPTQDNEGKLLESCAKVKRPEESGTESAEKIENSEEVTENTGGVSDNTLEANMITVPDNPEEKLDAHNGTEVDKNEASSAISEAGSVKRARRFFSVDDIINHIGNSATKTKSEEEVKRRHSWQTSNDFLQKESVFNINFDKLKAEKEKIADSNKYDVEIVESNKSADVPVNERFGSEEDTRIHSKGEDKSEDELLESKTEVPIEIANKPESKNDLSESKDDLKPSSDALMDTSSNTSIFPKTNKVVEEETANVAKHSIFEDSQQGEHEIEDNKELSDIPEDPLDLDTSSTMSFQKPDLNDLKDNLTQDSLSQLTEESRSAEEESKILEHTKVITESCTLDSNEVLYRNIIKVEESSILLQIAGELVEINVNNVNGKKVITVVSLSNSTVVDFNDNYESVDNSDRDPLKIDDIVAENDQSSDIIMQPEFVEPTSEIIIGMDLSLEEEINLDIEQPKKLCTKAAKKAYEYDLQIPSITTSEDVYDKSKTESYANDKVSSSREPSTKPKKSSSKSSKKSQSSKKSSSKNKEKHIKKIKKDHMDQETDFVLFSELVKARKLKKLKLKEKLKEDEKVDSTNVEDDVSNSHSIADNKRKDKSSRDGNNQKVEKLEHSKVEKTEEPTKHDSLIVNLPLQRKEEIVYKKDIEANVLKDEKYKEEVEKPAEQTSSEEKSSDKLEKPTIVEEQSVKQSCMKKTHTVLKDDTSKIKQDDSSFKTNSVDPVCVIKEDPLSAIKEVPVLENANASDAEVKPKALADGKRKLSLEEYINRKRRLLTMENKEAEPPPKMVDEKPKPREESQKVSKPERIKFPRPKSLDDVGQQPVRESIKRKFSLQETLRPPSFDWEETQSPKIHQVESRKFSEFRGLINDTKTKTSSPSVKSMSSNVNTTGDQILQKYKVQVESKLSSLNLQIPKIVKPAPTVSNPKNLGLIQRFLRDEKLTPTEIDKIKKIIEYKRVAQKLNPILKTPEANKEATQDVKLTFKKLLMKKNRKRFRNLYTESTSESEEEPQPKKNISDYSVVQSNCLAGVVPKLIIKRKTDFPVPIVRLERLDLGLLSDKKRKYPDFES